jgi:V8-like Glu-specific endopeptidase
MSETTQSPVTREGKAYGYQKPQESAAGASPLATDNKQQLISAFEAFIDGLVCRVPTAPTTGAPTTGTPTTGSTTTTGAPATGTPMTGTPTTGTKGGGTATTGEAPTEAAKLQESLERSAFAQREAFRVDRERESAKLSRRALETEAVSNATGAAGGIVLLGKGNMHQSDSNRAPLTQNQEFAPAFGAMGKGAGATVERMSVASIRPETAPAPGPVAGLRPIDAYWATFGTAVERAAVRANVDNRVMLESIIGNDDRVRVTNNTLYPWRCVCSLLITAQSGTQYIGTGWLVAPRLVLTAGHCVYMSDEGGWGSSIEVVPGRDATTRPFGSALSRDLRSVTGWTQDNNSDCDYGAILLPADKRFGEQLGWFGYAVRPDDYLRQITLNLSGYPGDGGKAPNQVQGTQWFNSRGVLDVMPRQITYEIDTFGGQSGAPVWEMAADGTRYGVAIHTHGMTVSNGATRIVGEVFDNIVLWAGQAP